MLKRGNNSSFWTVLAGVWCLIASHALSVSAVTLANPSFYRQYPYIFIVEDDQLPPTFTDEQFLDSAASITFPVGISKLPANAPLLDELRNNIIPSINGDSLQLLRIVLRGAASPEGPTELNRRLGRERVQSLLTFLTEHLQFPMADDILSVDTDIEDYRSLCLFMKRAGDPDYELVKQLCDTYLEQDLPVLKRTLMNANGGRLWKRLLATYFPQLRTARLLMVFRKYTPPTTVPAVAIEPIQAVEAVTPTVPEAPALVDTLPVIEAAPVLVIDTLPSVLQRRELLSLKTNLLFYAAYIPGYDRWCPIPNVAIEYYPKSGHFTFGASFDMPWWQDYDAHKYFQLRNYQAEVRYYLRPTEAYSRKEALSGKQYKAPAFSGFYAQAYVHGGLFGICFDANRGWVGEGYGAGLGVGYVTPISRNGHWRLEFGLQAGFFRCKYDPYKYENPVNPAFHDDLYYYKWTQKPELFKKRQYRWNWIGPTRIGITLTYDLLYRRIQKRGASFKSTESRTTPSRPTPSPSL